MKRSMIIVLAALLTLVQFPVSGNAQVAPTEVRTFVLSNELGATGLQGGLIDQLIAAGHGSDNLYQVLQFLAADPSSGIPADFVAEVGANLGSEVYTTVLNNVASPFNNPIGISADGTLIVTGIHGRDYDGDTGYTTNTVYYPNTGLANFTMAQSDTYYIDAGTLVAGSIMTYYKAIGIAYANNSRSFVLSNESPGFLIDKLIAAGHGSDNLHQVLTFLAAQAGSGIPADFVVEVGASPVGSDVFTVTLNNFAGPNGPVGINADGSLIIAPIYARYYDGQTGYTTNFVQYSGIGLANFTMAQSDTYYIDAGDTPNGDRYQAIGIAWAPPAPIPTLNEWGLILLSLALAVVSLVYMKRRREAEE